MVFFVYFHQFLRICRHQGIINVFCGFFVGNIVLLNYFIDGSVAYRVGLLWGVFGMWCWGRFMGCLCVLGAFCGMLGALWGVLDADR